MFPLCRHGSGYLLIGFSCSAPARTSWLVPSAATPGGRADELVRPAKHDWMAGRVCGRRPDRAAPHSARNKSGGRDARRFYCANNLFQWPPARSIRPTWAAPSAGRRRRRRPRDGRVGVACRRHLSRVGSLVDERGRPVGRLAGRRQFAPASRRRRRITRPDERRRGFGRFKRPSWANGRALGRPLELGANTFWRRRALGKTYPLNSRLAARRSRMCPPYRHRLPEEFQVVG